MTSKATLLTEKDFKVERVIEVKIIDRRAREGIKQKSFSIFVKEGTKNKDYPKTIDIKNFFERNTHKLNNKVIGDK